MKQKKLRKAVTKGLAQTPTILQMEIVECGAASLAMVLAYYRRYIPLEQLRVDCGVSRDGSNAGQVAKAARKHGLKSQGKRHSLATLRDEATRPCMLFWGFGHFLVFEGMKGDRYQVNDPSGGRRLVDEDEFSRSFTGITVEFEPGPDFEPSGSPPSLLRGFQDWLGGNTVATAFALLCGILLSIPGILIPGLTSAFIDGVVQESNASWTAWIVAGQLVMVVFQVSLVGLQSVCLNRMQFRMFMIQSLRMGDHLLRLPIRFFEQRQAGDLVARFTAIQTISWRLTAGLLRGLVNLATAIIYATALLIYNPLIGAIAVFATVAMLGAVRFTNNYLVDRNTSLQQEIGRQQGALMLLLRDIPEIKATSREGEAFSQWAGYQAKSVNANQMVSQTSTWLDAAPVLVGGLIVSVIVLVVGGLEVMRGNISIGGLIAMQMLAALLIAPVSQLVMLARILQTTQAQMARVLDVMNYDADPDVRIDAQTDVSNARKLGGAVALEGVSFGFDPTIDPTLLDLSFTLDPGEMVALVGPSGSGKSTIVNLLLGLERPWEGSICFDGTPREQIDPAILIGSVTGASPPVAAFDASLRDNVTMWDASIDDKEIVDALFDADCSELLERNGGLDTPIAEAGHNLSGGQLQRLELARTLARRPSVLILDGATSALDGETEARVLQRIRDRGCTTILVTARSSSLRFADKILIAGEGGICDQGQQAELANRNEWFRSEFGAVS
jgi:NHLM bacteriocin system ABC transporter peptidase/ATP-binding protein